MPYPNEHAARIRQPGGFNPATFRRTSGGKAVLPGSGLITVPSSIKIIWGKLKSSDQPSDEPVVQALRFPIKSYTAEQAKSWLTTNKVKYISFEKASGAKSEDEEYYEAEIIAAAAEKKPCEMVLAAPIFDYTAERFIEKVNELEDDEDILVYLNSPGGTVFAGWSIIGRLKMRTGKLKIVVLGHAASMAFLFSAFGDEVEALDVTKFMVHRATGYIRNEDDQKTLDDINADLLGKLKKRIDTAKFKEITGTTLDKLWSQEERKDVWLSAKQAKEIGLIDKINRLEPKKMEAYIDKFVAFMDFDDDSHGSEFEDLNPAHGSVEEQPIEINNVKQKSTKKMTRQELKNSEPEVHSEILEAGETSGVDKERDRVKSWLAFIDIDKDTVIKAIKDGTAFTQSVMAEMTVKATAKREVVDTETDSAGELKTTTPKVKTKEEEAIEAFDKEVDEGIDAKNLVI